MEILLCFYCFLCFRFFFIVPLFGGKAKRGSICTVCYTHTHTKCQHFSTRINCLLFLTLEIYVCTRSERGRMRCKRGPHREKWEDEHIFHLNFPSNSIYCNNNNEKYFLNSYRKTFWSCGISNGHWCIELGFCGRIPFRYGIKTSAYMGLDA